MCLEKHEKTPPAHARLRHAPHKQSSHSLLLTPHRNLRSNATFRRVGHLDESCYLATTKSLTVQLESVGAVGEGDVRSIQWLERECFGELLRCICSSVSVRLS